MYKGTANNEQVWRCHRREFARVYAAGGTYVLQIAGYRGAVGQVPAKTVPLPSPTWFVGVTRCRQCGAGKLFWQVGRTLYLLPTVAPTFATVVDGSVE